MLPPVGIQIQDTFIEFQDGGYFLSLGYPPANPSFPTRYGWVEEGGMTNMGKGRGTVVIDKMFG